MELRRGTWVVGLISAYQQIFLRPRMRLFVDLQNMARIYVRIALRRGQAGMAEELLDGPQVSPALEQMGGEAMSQAMRADALRKGELPHAPLDDEAHGPIRQSAPTRIDEQGIGAWPGPGADG